ncbi:MAG TPA: hypothetical protein VM782_13155, partial [Stellaceae bacterium]|nr:hypothetical protein [Stellaceae bacterium]
MIGNIMQKGAWRLPDIRSVAQPIAIAAQQVGIRRKHALLASVAGIAVVAIAFTTVGYVRHTRSVTEAQVAASQVESANIDLQDQLGRLRDEIAASNRDLMGAQARVAALTEEMRAHAQAPAAAQPAASPGDNASAPAKGDKVAQLSQQLHVAEAQRATLAARLSKAEADLAEQQQKQAELLSQIDQWQKKLEQLVTDHDRLKARVGELEKQSAAKRAQAVAAATPAPAAATAASAAPAPATVATTALATPQPQAQPQPAPEGQRVAGVLNAPQPAAGSVMSTAQAVAAAPVAVAQAAAAVATTPVVVAQGAVDRFARVLASAGVDVRHLFAEYGVNRGEGGPVVPLARGQAIAQTELTPEKIAALRAMV